MVRANFGVGGIKGGEKLEERGEPEKKGNFVCPVCGMTFATKEELEKHAKEKHGKK